MYSHPCSCTGGGKFATDQVVALKRHVYDFFLMKNVMIAACFSSHEQNTKIVLAATMLIYGLAEYKICFKCIQRFFLFRFFFRYHINASRIVSLLWCAANHFFLMSDLGARRCLNGLS